jgi:hypothetical protein
MRELRTVWSVLDAYSRGMITQGEAMRALHLRPGEEAVLRTALAEAGHAPPSAIIPLSAVNEHGTRPFGRAATP